MKNSTHIIFDVLKIKDKQASGRLVIFDNFHYSTYPCVSGPYGKGYLPFGKYKVVSCYEKDDTIENKPFKRDGVPWIAGIIPTFKTERFDLAIHPDGNIPGSLGCVVITQWDLKAKDEILRLLKKYKVLTFKVI